MASDIHLSLSEETLKALQDSADGHGMGFQEYISRLLLLLSRQPDPLAWLDRVDSAAKDDVHAGKQNPISAPWRMPVPALLPLVNLSVQSGVDYLGPRQLTEAIQEFVFHFYLAHWCSDPENPTTAEIADVESLLAANVFDFRSFSSFVK